MKLIAHPSTWMKEKACRFEILSIDRMASFSNTIC
jgi:hypothetical protein